MMINNSQAPILITGANISRYFDVIDGFVYNNHEYKDHWFEWDNEVQAFVNTNKFVEGSSATTTLISKKTFSFSFDYLCATEEGYDIFSAAITNMDVYLDSNGQIDSLEEDISKILMFDYVSGNKTGSETGIILEGQRLYFHYTKDSTASSDEDTVAISNFYIFEPKPIRAINYNDLNSYMTITEIEVKYGFIPDGKGSFISNNYGIDDAYASTVFNAKSNLTLVFSWECSSEKNYDKFFIYKKNLDLLETSGETSGVFHTRLLAGESLWICYEKDSTESHGDDECRIFDLRIYPDSN